VRVNRWVGLIWLVCLAVLLGLLAGLGLGVYALIGVLVACGVFLAGVVVEPRYYALAVLILLTLAPWQKFTMLQNSPWAFPILWVVLVLVLLAAVKGALRNTPVRHLVLGLGVVVWTVLALWFGYGRLGLVLRWSGLWIAGVGLFCLMSVNGSRAVLLKGIPAIGTIVSGYVIVETVLKHNPLYAGVVATSVEPAFLAAATFRPTGSVGHPLVVADFVGLAIIVTLVALRVGAVRPPIAVPFLMLELLGLASTGARGAIITTILAAAAAFAVSSEVFGRRVRSAILFLAIGGIVWAAVGSVLLARFAGVVQSASLQQRLSGFAAAAFVVRDSPIFGRGAGYGPLALRELGYRIINYETEWAGLLIGLGVPGALMVLSAPLLAMKDAMSMRWRGPAREVSIACAVYALGIIGTHNVFEWWGGAMLFWVCVAFTVPSEELTASDSLAGAVMS